MRDRNRDPLWTSDFVIASLVTFGVVTVSFLLMTSQALYAVDRFGAGDSAAGLAASIFVISGTSVRLFAGNFVELIGRRRSLLVSLLAYALASATYLLADSLEALLVVRLLHGIAFGIGTTAVMTVAQSLIPASRRAEGTGYFTLSTTGATAVGPFLALVLLDGPGFRGIFVACTAISVLVAAGAFLVRVPEVNRSAEQAAQLRRFHPRYLLQMSAMPLTSFVLVLGVAFSAVVTFINPYAIGEGLGTGAKAFFLVYAAVVFLSRLFVGRLQDVRGENSVIYPGIVLFAAGLIVISQAADDLVLTGAGAVLGAGWGTLMSATQAVVVADVPPHRLGVAVSTYYFMLDLGTGLGPIVLGALIEVTDYRTMFLLMGVVVLLSVAHYGIVHGRRARHAGHGAPGVRQREQAGQI